MGANRMRRPGEFADLVPGFDMQANRNGWPSAVQHPDHQQWFHSDIKDVAFVYTWPVFEHIVTVGGLR